jgi:cell wall-associated NlpC family hydrolase
VTGAQIVAQARTYLGVRYRHQGRSREGCDCVGLLACISEDLGVPVIYNTNYDHKPELQVFLDLMTQHCRDIPLTVRAPGDIALFRLPTGQWHTAVLTDADGMLHASLPLRKTVEHRLDEGWARQLKRVFRWQGVRDG